MSDFEDLDLSDHSPELIANRLNLEELNQRIHSGLDLDESFEQHDDDREESSDSQDLPLTNIDLNDSFTRAWGNDDNDIPDSSNDVAHPEQFINKQGYRPV